ncbi:hypothetical protein SARC_08348 [Sphaeroforma arctica JP610]|uniref:GH16 domain-containing protein n=1 Tax=Sphaeroforma arctica JP610 TaxID=667725 RepID=A0A0L0FTH7_9EUKA|nr:hypothetical protein SARC_08348 [Sphaeroforma arctica JP610]KNC79253.1 hypothetical protein SARC_08348 [Sphaeroforma arctica JP610]|eukprot:XP_014153155.1 hypothetical protein SARC_08348 [Sphaeroforma arctica JP610]
MLFSASASVADLIWSDEFDGAAIDQGKWGYDILPAYKYNNELQEYTSASANSFVKDGLLHISAVPMGMGGIPAPEWCHATKETGRLWPAIWMLPTGSPNKWPKGGEIDILEHVTCDANRVHATVHTGAYNWPMNKQVGSSISVHDVRDFHEYALEWSPTAVIVLLDGNEYFSFDNDNTKDLLT